MLRNCFLFVLVGVMTTALFVAQTTWSNLLWLYEMQMPITGKIIITTMISDLMGLNGGGVLPIPMVAIISAVLLIAFAVARILLIWIMINPVLLYSIGGAAGIWTFVFLMPFFFFDVDVMAGARTALGKLVLAFIGGIGGYLFGSNLTRSES
ncbi:MAG: hypothetical protein CMK28_06465 [Porticoccaceae bacterium]|nr:hypothetical protein [Porticoccaceae bacterium]